MFNCESHQTTPFSCVVKVMAIHRAWPRRALPACLVYTCAFGCGGSDNINVDLSADAPRFIIHSPIVGWPFRWPMVTAFAIASEEDGAAWELRSADPGGLPARHLAIIYGQVPSGFYQVIPGENVAPPALRNGRSYFVGATGPKAAFRAVFALPIDPLDTSPAPPGVHGANPSSRNHSNR